MSETKVKTQKARIIDNSDKGTSFTLTDFKEIDFYKVYEDYKDKIRGIAWGQETCPTTGTKHNQGFVQLFTQGRKACIKKMCKNNQIHLEVMKGSIKQNEKYCKKEGKYEELGCFVSRGYRSDLHNIKDDLENGANMYTIMNNYTSDFVRYHSGIGKMKELIDKKISKVKREITLDIIKDEDEVTFDEEDVFRIDETCDQRFLFNGYDNEKIILIEKSNGFLSSVWLTKIIEGKPFRLNMKNGCTYAKWTRVIITTDGCSFKLPQPNLKKVCLKAIKGNTDNLYLLLKDELSKLTDP